ncbi:Retrotransposon gag domain [Arabidopsis thaliana x Arabidopsis arenosa]|uniref:Retrotransposon gag domain n=1 Tax=Arabidopsis thaliana x Arabidopsis arenosa TaxID=1240361 RepID=A0A8T2FM89_9BRAS|nr:Retrotransposon gag domain [Arabidopsis thaliana x Arabidopsis arenosa]
MPRQTRSTQQKEPINLSVLDLGKLERTNRKTQRLAMDDRVIRADAEGVLGDEDGQAYNEAGQRLDDHGLLLPEDANEDQARLNAQLAARDAIGLGVDRHLREQNADTIGVERHNRGVDRHQPQNLAAIPPAAELRLGQHPFHGLSHEQPMDHIERFEDLVLSIKANGVSQDYLLCKLFPYSLAGEAASLLKQLKAGSLKTWRSIKIAFLNNLYDDVKSEELRNKLSTFTQGPAEAFKAAWVRFKEYQQMALDAASNGNFNTRYPADATALIENLVCSNSTKNADFERKKIVGAVSGNQMAEDYKKFGQPQGNFSGNRFTGNQSYTPKPAFQKSFPHSNFERTYGNSAYQAPLPPSSESIMQSMLEKILESQTKLVVEFNGKFDAVYTDLNGKIDNLSSHLKKLDVQVAQTTQSIKRQEDFLPVNPDANPTKSCNAILIREGDDVWKELDIGDELELATAELPETAYTPPVPYPKKRRSKQEIHAAKCTTIMEKILISLPKDASKTSSTPLNRYVKRVVDNEISSAEAKLLTRDISAILLPKVKKEKAQRVDIAEYIRSITPD